MDLHVALHDAMGWLDYHLHIFRVTTPGTAQAVQIGIPDEDASKVTSPSCPAGKSQSLPTFLVRVSWLDTNTTSATVGNTT